MKYLFYTAIILSFSTAALAQDSSYHFTTSDGVVLYLRVAGKGNPCLFIHGGPGNTSHYFEALPAAKSLEQKMQMIYYDQRGSGRSASSLDSNYSMKRMEMDIEEIRTFLKITKWSVIGHSFGGLVMTAYAKDYPERIRSLVFAHCTVDLNSALRSHIDNGTKLLEEVGDTITIGAQLTPFEKLMKVHGELANKGIEYKIMFRSQHEKDVDDSLITEATPHFNQDFNRRVWAGLKDYWIDYATYTRDITCPVLVIAGTKDYAVGPGNYKSWQFKNMQLALYDGGHVSFQEEPAWFTEKVLHFLGN